MKKLITYLLFLPGLVWFTSCDNPAPTELFDDTLNDEAEYEILGKDYNDEFNSNGLDTTGVTQDINSFANLISVSGVRETDETGNTIQYSFAQAFFFDLSNPVRDANGRLLGFNTVNPGIIRFDNKLARTVPFRIRYRENGMLKEVTLGDKYLLFSGRRIFVDDFQYRHNSFVPFHLNMSNGQNVSFNILTPTEIIGLVNILGSRDQENLRASLRWNTGNTQQITIIISARLRDKHINMPLFKVRTRDDGKLIIPEEFINNIPLEVFDHVVFTFVRRFEVTDTHNGNTLKVSSQSIHSIALELH
jgi:hypothetical protein